MGRYNKEDLTGEEWGKKTREEGVEGRVMTEGRRG